MNEVVVYYILVQASLFALGSAGVATVFLLRFKPSYWWAYVLFKLGVMAITGVILALVLPLQSVAPKPQTYVYIVGVLACAVGAVGVSRDLLKRFGRYAMKSITGGK